MRRRGFAETPNTRTRVRPYGLLGNNHLSLTKVEAATRVVNVPPDPNLNVANLVNNDPATTATAFQLAPNFTYRVTALIILKPGDELRGAVPSGTPRKVGPATDPDPTTKLVNGAALESLIALRGDNAITWLDISGADFKGQAGGGSAIAAGSGNDNTLIQFNQIHHNGAAGITNARGHILDNEIDHNTTEPAALGFIAAGVKGNIGTRPGAITCMTTLDTASGATCL